MKNQNEWCKKGRINITLDQDVIYKMQELAMLDDRSLSQFINRILKHYLNNKNT